MYQDTSAANLTGQYDSKVSLQQRLQDSHHSASQYFNPEAIETNCADALLPLFVKIQKLLRYSSLDRDIKNDTDRFDERVDKAELPQRDEYDKKVSETALTLRNVLSNILSERTVELKLPFSHKRAVHNVFATEIRQFIMLLNVMSRDVTNLMHHIDGKYMKPLEIEHLWTQIQNNLIPNTWRKYSFQTAFISLADFIIELVDKVKFWQNLLKSSVQVPAVWIPGFFDPSQYLNALRQRKSREENIPARKIKNSFEVTDIEEPTDQNCVKMPNTAYIYGVWLEGASWDREQKLLVE